jgi:hypothetical protein
LASLLGMRPTKSDPTRQAMIVRNDCGAFERAYEDILDLCDALQRCTERFQIRFAIQVQLQISPSPALPG